MKNDLILIGFMVIFCGLVWLGVSRQKVKIARMAIQAGYSQMIDLHTGEAVWVRPAITNIYAPKN